MRAPRLPEEVPVIVLRGGRAVGRSLPAVEPGTSLAEWRAAFGKKPFLLRTDAEGIERLAEVRRLATVGEVWLDAGVHDVDEALDLLVAGAARLRVDPADAERVDAVGPSCLLAWDGRGAWEAVEALALEHHSPVVAEAEIPAGARCDAFRLEGSRQGGPAPEHAPERLVRVAQAPATEDAE